MPYNFNTDPYFDDHVELQKYLKVLFRPGVAVQARELTQIQSIFQKQVDSIGRHLFKNGSPVYEGAIKYEARVKFYKISNVSFDLNNTIGKLFTGQTSGVTAFIYHVESATTLQPDDVIYLRYQSAGNNGERLFQEGEVISTSDNSISLTLQSSSSSSVASGLGSLLSIADGIYYIDGYFVPVKSKTIVLNRYNTEPSFICGLLWSHEITTPEIDSNLNDNSTGSPNYAAPGAHRYHIDPVLTAIPYYESDTTDKTNFIKLFAVERGQTRYFNTSPYYNKIGDELAKRTHIESGNYIATPYRASAIEDRNNFIENWYPSSDYLVDDVIRISISGNKYSFKCVSSGTTGSSIPAFAAINTIFSDNTVSWQYVTSSVLVDGAYPGVLDPSVTPQFLTQGDESKYNIEVEGGSAVVNGYLHQQTGKIRLKNNKARDFGRKDGGTVQCPSPNYIIVDNPSAFPDTLGTDIIRVSMWNQFSTVPGTPSGIEIGSCDVRWIEKHTSGTTLYRVYVSDIITAANVSYERNVKCLHFTNGTSSIDFTGNIYQTYQTLEGTISGDLVNAPNTIVGVGTSFSTELKVHDYITPDNGVNSYQITSISGTDLTIVNPLNSSFSGQKFTLLNSHQKYNPNFSIYKLSHSFIRNIRSSDDLTSDTIYNITRKFSDQNTTTLTQLTYSLSGDDIFANTIDQNFTIIDTATGAIESAAVFTRSTDSQTLTVTNLTIGTDYRLFGTIKRSNTLEAGKPLATHTFDITNTSDIRTITGRIVLGKADCVKLVSVHQAASFGAISSTNQADTDITHMFKLDTGQKQLYYDLGGINTSQPQAKGITGSIQVVYTYYNHTNLSNRDFFSCDSYTATQYNKINPEVRDSLDFRPVKNDNGVGFKSLNFGIIKADSDITADWSFYLPRLDYLVLSDAKKLKIINGISALEPKPPTISGNEMILYSIGNAPFTGKVNSDVLLKSVKHRRWQMKDISRLEDRINTLEYYTALSLKEAQTENMIVTDPDGFNMFKNGFVVESFNNESVVDRTNIDSRNIVNTSQGTLIPGINEDYVTFDEDAEPSDRVANGYRVTQGVDGDWATLPFDSKKYISSKKASRVVNLNPFAVVSFKGSMTVYPSSDIWVDTKSINLNAQNY